MTAKWSHNENKVSLLLSVEGSIENPVTVLEMFSVQKEVPFHVAKMNAVPCLASTYIEVKGHTKYT